MGEKTGLVVAIACIFIGILGLLFTGVFQYRFYGMMGETYRKSSYTSNGERIYYTATNDSGQRIHFSVGPSWLYMIGGSCVNCHGVNGKGGVPVMMSSKVAPDITYQSLISGKHKHGDEHENEAPYTDDLIKRAITNGIDASGHPLDKSMPRFKISEKDLNDLLGYLRSLGIHD